MGCLHPVALLPVLPIAYGIWAYTSFLRGIDELQRRIQLDGLASVPFWAC